MNSDIANYVDGTTLYECAPHYDKFLKSDNLQKIWWFKYNNFKANSTNCHFSLSPYQSATIKHQ